MVINMFSRYDLIVMLNNMWRRKRFGIYLLRDVKVLFCGKTKFLDDPSSTEKLVGHFDVHLNLLRTSIQNIFNILLKMQIS